MKSNGSRTADERGACERGFVSGTPFDGTRGLLKRGGEQVSPARYLHARASTGTFATRAGRALRAKETEWCLA
jgi:hypothetical protein